MTHSHDDICRCHESDKHRQASNATSHAMTWHESNQLVQPALSATPRSILNSCFWTHSSPLPRVTTRRFKQANSVHCSPSIGVLPPLSVAWTARINAGLWFNKGNCSFTSLSTLPCITRHGPEITQGPVVCTSARDTMLLPLKSNRFHILRTKPAGP